MVALTDDDAYMFSLQHLAKLGRYNVPARAFLPTASEQLSHVTTSAFSGRNGPRLPPRGYSTRAQKTRAIKAATCPLQLTLSHPDSVRDSVSIPAGDNTCPSAEVKAGIFGLAPISSTLLSNPCADPFPPARRSGPRLPFQLRTLHPTPRHYHLHPLHLPRPIALSASITREHTYR
jgi:hypothetical protein